MRYKGKKERPEQNAVSPGYPQQVLMPFHHPPCHVVGLVFAKWGGESITFTWFCGY